MKTKRTRDGKHLKLFTRLQENAPDSFDLLKGRSNAHQKTEPTKAFSIVHAACRGMANEKMTSDRHRRWDEEIVAD